METGVTNTRLHQFPTPHIVKSPPTHVLLCAKHRHNSSTIKPLFLFWSGRPTGSQAFANRVMRTYCSHSIPPSQTERDLREFGLKQAGVSMSLAKSVFSTQSADHNLVFSPFSLLIQLGLIASGSKGPSQEQLLGFLKSKSVKELHSIFPLLVATFFNDGSLSRGPLLCFANGVWVDQSQLKPTFKIAVNDVYNSVSRNVDFQSKSKEVGNEVNAWTEKRTNGLVNDILPRGSIDSLTRIILANVMYFQGAWDQEFHESTTGNNEFYLSDGTPIQVPFMTSNEKQYVEYFHGFKVLGLPYKQVVDNRKFSIYFFLPDKRDGLPALLETISSESGFIEHHLPRHQVKLSDFRVPKFEITFDFQPSEVLKKLGMASPFKDGLTEMTYCSTSGEKLYVSEMFHNSFIEVNEEGTKAAVAFVTGVKRKMSTGKSEIWTNYWDFVADHPFLFVLREDTTGVVLFVGQVFNPLLLN